ncbi:MAG: tetratricopeptide repeat protein [Thermoplasmata archaeon]|nr:tetratricopeptide repeat protein [Thermoplasmata archaeon]
MTRNPLFLVDREQELAFLRQVMEEGKIGRGHTVLITGDVGIGKTRLVEEFMDICQKEGFAVLPSICIGNNQPAFLPVGTALQTYAKKVRERPDMYVPIGLAGFQSLEIETSNPAEVVKERTRMLEYLLHQFAAIAKQQPVLFVIDDLHLADSATLAFFHYLARNIRNERIIAVGTFVEEFASTENIFANTLKNMNIERLPAILKLANLGEKEINQIVEQMGFGETEELAKYLNERTSGNPLFIIEFLAATKNTGLTEIEAIKKMSLPENVKDIVRFRVSKLPERTRKVLATCAVLGRIFEYGVLSALAGLQEEELLDSIEELISQNFLVETEEFEEGYKFVSNTAHEVIYADITGVRRRILHQKAAEVIEKLHGTDERFWSGLARHYREGGNKTKFLEYAVKAGRSAASRFANAEAIAHLKGALEVLDETPDNLQKRIEVMWELAEVLELEGRYGEALEMLDKRIMVTATNNPFETGKSHRKKSEISIYRGDYDRALAECERAEQFLTELTDAKLELARVWSAKGMVYERKGDYVKGIEWQNRALGVFEKINAEKDVGSALNKIGLCLWYLGECDKALEQYQKSLAIREKIKDLRGIAMSYNNIGLVNDTKGNHEKALGYYEKSLGICEKIGDVWGIAISYNNIGLIYSSMGDYDKALRYYEKSIGICEKIGDVWGIALVCNNIGALYGRKGDYEKALEYCEKSLGIYKKIGDVMGIARAYAEIALIHEAKGDYELALKSSQETIALGKQIQNNEMIATGFVQVCEIYLSKSEIGPAKEHLKEGKKHLGEHCDKKLIAYSDYVEGKLLAAERREEEARKILKTAIKMYDEIKSHDTEYYMALFEIGRIERDVETLKKSLAFFEKIGNRIWVERVKDVLENLG